MPDVPAPDLEAFELADAQWPEVERSARRLAGASAAEGERLLAYLVDGLNAVLDRFGERSRG